MFGRIHGAVWVGLLLGAALVFLLFSVVAWVNGEFWLSTGDVVISLFLIAGAVYASYRTWPCGNKFPPSMP